MQGRLLYAQYPTVNVVMSRYNKNGQPSKCCKKSQQMLLFREAIG